MKFEREFFRLAAVWLHCRELGMDPAEPLPAWRLLGEVDYQIEMEMLCAEALR